MYYVYIIKSQKVDSYYIGHTENINDRLKRHNNGRNKSTKSKAPWVLIYIEEFQSRSEAMKREMGIKKKKSKRYIEWLIKN